MMKLKIILLLGASILSGCGTLGLSPTANEPREVKVTTDNRKTITIPEGMAFYDSRPATRGIRFPQGKYILEAEDSEYFYFRSPTPLEMRVFQNGTLTEEREMEGGLMVGKSTIKMVPGGGYIDGEDGKKVLICKLGQEFLLQEGKAWSKTY